MDARWRQVLRDLAGISNGTDRHFRSSFGRRRCQAQPIKLRSPLLDDIAVAGDQDREANAREQVAPVVRASGQLAAGTVAVLLESNASIRSDTAFAADGLKAASR